MYEETAFKFYMLGNSPQRNQSQSPSNLTSDSLIYFWTRVKSVECSGKFSGLHCRVSEFPPFVSAQSSLMRCGIKCANQSAAVMTRQAQETKALFVLGLETYLHMRTCQENWQLTLWSFRNLSIETFEVLILPHRKSKFNMQHLFPRHK